MNDSPTAGVGGISGGISGVAADTAGPVGGGTTLTATIPTGTR